MWFWVWQVLFDHGKVVYLNPLSIADVRFARRSSLPEAAEAGTPAAYAADFETDLGKACRPNPFSRIGNGAQAHNARATTGIPENEPNRATGPQIPNDAR